MSSSSIRSSRISSSRSNVKRISANVMPRQGIVNDAGAETATEKGKR